MIKISHTASDELHSQNVMNEWTETITMSLRRGVQNVIKSEIKLGLPLMVLDLECKF